VLSCSGWRRAAGHATALAQAQGRGHVRVQDGALSPQFDDQLRCRVVSLLGRSPSS
jgi:alpha-galactosidase